MLVSFRPLSRLIVAVFCTSLAVALLGANAPSFFSAPTIVFFPLRPATGLDPNAGIGYANRLGAAVKALGGINVIMGDPATAPADFLHAAKAAGGEYYFMGSVAPPTQSAVPVIEEIVSTRSGTVVWSSTAYIAVDDDLLRQAPILKDALVKYGSRAYADILNPTPRPAHAATPPPPQKRGVAVQNQGGGATPGTHPGVDAPPLKLPNEAYGFSSKPTAQPKLYASAGHPSRFVLLTFVGNGVTPAMRDYTVTSLVNALKNHGQSALEGDPNTTGHRLPSVALCEDTGAGYLVFGSVSASAQKPNEYDNYIGAMNALLNITAYDCNAQKFVPPMQGIRGTGGRWNEAIDRASNSAVTRYLLKAATTAKTS